MSESLNGCGKIRGLLEPYFEGVLAAAEERLVAEHLWQCPNCAAELEQICRLSVALNALPVAEPEADLLAAISARLAALPTPRERRLLFGWRRLGLAEVLVLALLAVGWYGLRLFGPHLLLAAQPLLLSLSHTYTTFHDWVSVNYHALLRLLGLARNLAPLAGQAILAFAPRLALYVAVELVLVAGTALLSRNRRRHSAAQPMSPRRS